MKGEFINGFRMRKGLQGNAVRYACYLLRQNPRMPVTRFRAEVCKFADISDSNSGWLTKEVPGDSRFPTGKLWSREQQGARAFLTLMPEAMPLVGTHLSAENFKLKEREDAMAARSLEVGSLVSWTRKEYSSSKWNGKAVHYTGVLVNTKCRGRNTVEILCNGKIEQVSISSLNNVNIKE